MHTQISMVVFDMDGVLVDTEQSIADFWHGQASKYGFCISKHEESKYISGCSSKSTIAALFPKGINIEEDILTSLQIYETNLQYDPIPGVVSIINQLNQLDMRVALVTGAEPWKVKAVLKCLNLTGKFTHIITAKDVTHCKPHPEPYLLCAELANLSPNDCIVFEDSENGVRSATVAGMQCIGVFALTDKNLLDAAGAKAFIRDFSDVNVSPGKIVLDNKSYHF